MSLARSPVPIAFVADFVPAAPMIGRGSFTTAPVVFVGSAVPPVTAEVYGA